MSVYGCLVSDCMESWTESLHKTKSGAYFAGRKWLLDRFNEDNESRAVIGKNSTDFIFTGTWFKVIKMDILE